MTSLGQVHLPAQFTVPFLSLAAAGLLWYWLRLGSDSVPASRRRIRRVSIGLILLGLPVLARALSFVDPALPAEHREYVVMWTAVLLFVLAIVVTAAIDVVNNLRLHHASQVAEMHDAAARLRDAIGRHGERSRAQRIAQSASPNGQSTRVGGAS